MIEQVPFISSSDDSKETACAVDPRPHTQRTTEKTKKEGTKVSPTDYRNDDTSVIGNDERDD